MSFFLVVFGMVSCHDAADEAVHDLRRAGYHFTIRDYIKAAATGDIRNLGRFVAAGMRPDTVDSDGNTPLLVASGRGELLSVKFLLDIGAAVDKRNRSGRTALIAAAEGGHLDVARMLLQQGALDRGPDGNGWTPLTVSAYRGHADLVRLFAGDAAQPLLDEALRLAALHGDPQTVSVLLSHGAHSNATGDGGMTPLMIAAQRGNGAAVRVLLENRAHPAAVNSAGSTAADLARAARHEALARFMDDPESWGADNAANTGPERSSATPSSAPSVTPVMPRNRREPAGSAQVEEKALAGAAHTSEIPLVIEYLSANDPDVYAVLTSPERQFRYVVREGDIFRVFDSNLEERDFKVLQIGHSGVGLEDLQSGMAIDVAQRRR